MEDKIWQEEIKRWKEKQEQKKYWQEKFINVGFLVGIFELYLRRNKLWRSSYEELMGVKFRSRDLEVNSDYDEIDEDFIEVFILRFNGKVVRKGIPLSNFLNWQLNRHE